MRWHGACVVLVVALAAGAQAHAANRWPVSEMAEQNSPEVLQLLRKTGNAFKQVGDILLKKTGSASSACPVHGAHGVPPYGVYPQPQPLVYYPMPYPGAHQAYPAPPPQYSTGASRGESRYSAELSDHLAKLAEEYREAAQKECSCGNVEVNMRRGPSSLASGKTSDIVVEVTLGDLTQTDTEEYSSESQKKTVNLLNVSEASEASIEDKTCEDEDDVNTVQVVEAIKLRPETSPYQVETYDNTVAAVEKIIEKLVTVKSETQDTKTIESDDGETVINVKTYEETFPKTTKCETEISQGGYDHVVDQPNYGRKQAQSSSESHSQSYEQKVEVVEVQKQKLDELKKEANVVSEMVETVDIEQDGCGDNTYVQNTEARGHHGQQAVNIKVVDVAADHPQVSTGDSQYFEYEEYDDEDCVDKDADDLKKYFSSQQAPAAPKYASPAKEDDCKTGEHVLAEHPHPVENVKVVVQGSSGQAYAQGLQTHSALHKPAPYYEVPCEAHYGIPKRRQPNQQSYATSQQQTYAAPQQQSYATSQSSYSAPQQQSYAAPQQQRYANPQQQSYATSQKQSYSSPQQQSCAVHQQQSYAAPQQQSYAAPQKQSYANPQQQSYSGHQQQNYAALQQQNYASPQQLSYTAPQQQSYSSQKNAGAQGYSSTSDKCNPVPAVCGPSSSASYAAPQKQSYATPQKQSFSTITQHRTGSSNNQQTSQQSYSDAEVPQSAAYYKDSVQPAYASAEKQITGQTSQSTSYGSSTQHKITPAQYPKYYFTASSNSIYAPAMINSQPSQSYSSGESAQVVPQRYASQVEDNKPVQSYSSPAKTVSSVTNAAHTQSHVAPAKADLPVQSYSSPAKSYSSSPKVVAPAQSYSAPAKAAAFSESYSSSAQSYVSAGKSAVPAKSYSSPVQSYSSSSKIAAPIQSYSSPVQSYSSSSKIATPIQSYSSPVQSYSSSSKIAAPIQSYSSPVQSYSSSSKIARPIQSYSSPVQSYSSSSKIAAPIQSYSSSSKIAAPIQSYSSSSKIARPIQSYSLPIQSYSSSAQDYSLSSKIAAPIQSYSSQTPSAPVQSYAVEDSRESQFVVGDDDDSYTSGPVQVDLLPSGDVSRNSYSSYSKTVKQSAQSAPSAGYDGDDLEASFGGPSNTAWKTAAASEVAEAGY